MTKRRKRINHKRRMTTRPSPKAKKWVTALSALGNERWEEAVAYLLRFLKGIHKPVERIPVYFNLATCYLEQGWYDEALTILGQVADLTGDNPDLWFGRAVAFGCSGRLEQAIEAFEQFRRLAPVQVRLLGVDQMIEDLQQEQRGEIAPGSYLYEHLDAQLENNFDLGDYDLVERKARQMIGINNGRPDAHFALGLALLRQGRTEEAVVAFQDAHKLEADYVPTLYNIGYCFFQLNQLDQLILFQFKL